MLCVSYIRIFTGKRKYNLNRLPLSNWRSLNFQARRLYLIPWMLSSLFFLTIVLGLAIHFGLRYDRDHSLIGSIVSSLLFGKEISISRTLSLHLLNSFKIKMSKSPHQTQMFKIINQHNSIIFNNFLNFSVFSRFSDNFIWSNMCVLFI